MHPPERDPPTQRIVSTRPSTPTHAFCSRFEIDDTTRVCVVTLTGNLDSAGVEDLHPQVQELVRAGYRHFVFDMRELIYVGSLGLRLLVGLANQLRSDGTVALSGLGDGVRSVVEMTKVNQILQTYTTREDATVAVAAHSSRAGS